MRECTDLAHKWTAREGEICQASLARSRQTFSVNVVCVHHFVNCSTPWNARLASVDVLCHVERNSTSRFTKAKIKLRLRIRFFTRESIVSTRWSRDAAPKELWLEYWAGVDIGRVFIHFCWKIKSIKVRFIRREIFCNKQQKLGAGCMVRSLEIWFLQQIVLHYLRQPITNFVQTSWWWVRISKITQSVLDYYLNVW